MAKQKSIIVDCMDNCFVCGSPYVEIHHVIYGTANRKLSDMYGLVVPLCHEHHTGQTGVHFNRDFDLYLKKLAQRKFEAVYGANKGFREVFGKSYL
jgi:hypothetical protein